jgi:hypothetical protein
MNHDTVADLVSAYQAMAALSQAAIWAVLAAGGRWLGRREATPSGAGDSNDVVSTNP